MRLSNEDSTDRSHESFTQIHPVVPFCLFKDELLDLVLIFKSQIYHPITSQFV